MPWVSIPYTQKERRDKLVNLYKIGGIPSLYIVNKRGKVLNMKGVEDCWKMKNNSEELLRKWQEISGINNKV